MFVCRPAFSSILLRRHRRVGLWHSNSVSDVFGLTAVKRECSGLSDGRSGLSTHDWNNNNNNERLDSRHKESSEVRLSSVHGTSSPHCDNERAPSHSVDGEENELQLLYRAACTLRSATEAEITAEIDRDTRDGVAAVPPLPPSGWRVQHPAGSNYFVMTQTLRGGAKSAVLNTRRYQSVHDVFLQAVREKQRQHRLREHKKRQLRQRQNQEGKDDLNAGKSLESEGSSKKMFVDYGNKHQRHATLREVDSSQDSAGGVERADVHLTVIAPFRVYDPSFHDPTVDICEWSSFDVLVRKTVRPVDASNSGGEGGRVAQNPLSSRSHVIEDSALCMFVRLAYVNSEMRIRFIQFLSRHEAKSLEEHACFGKGEPTFLESVRSRRQSRATRRPLRSLYRYDEPLMSLQKNPKSSLAGGVDIESEGGAFDVAYELLTGCFDSGGEHSRSLCYSGPYLSELSKELTEALQAHMQGDLGLSAELCEYVCQMQFFLEQEEYMVWLGRLRHVASFVAESANK